MGLGHDWIPICAKIHTIPGWSLKLPTPTQNALPPSASLERWRSLRNAPWADRSARQPWPLLQWSVRTLGPNGAFTWLVWNKEAGRLFCILFRFCWYGINHRIEHWSLWGGHVSQLPKCVYHEVCWLHVVVIHRFLFWNLKVTKKAIQPLLQEK